MTTNQRRKASRKIHTVALIVGIASAICILLGHIAMEAEGKDGGFGGGTGTSNDPYLIEDVHDLQAMNNNLTAHYELANDIDASDTVNWNGGEGFEPVGKDSENLFEGSLDGRGYTITGLYINRNSTNFVGLFGTIEDVTLSNISLVDVNVTGYRDVGGLVGRCEGGSVSDCYATGTVTGTGSEVGGLAGKIEEGSVSNCYTTGTVTGTDSVGGLVGVSWGPVNNCYATGNVTGTGGDVGGLVGSNSASVSNCYATGTVTGTDSVGGLVGSNSGSVSNCYATGNVTGSYYYYCNVGGLVGSHSSDSVTNCYATGSVNGNGDDVGGFVGHIREGSVSDCYATGSVNGTGDDVGGFVGKIEEKEGSVSFCYATGNVTGSEYKVGGFVGVSRGPVSNCYATGNVTGTGGHVGGFIGYNAETSVTNCYATGNVTCSGDYAFGGFVGYNQGYVSRSYATGNVICSGKYAGGFVGMNSCSLVDNCYATGIVIGSEGVGGLVGYNSDGKVNNSYSTGNVNGTSLVGGLVGRKMYSSAANSFWDTETSGQTTSGEGTGMTTAEMKTQSTFTNASWDFINVWCMKENITYPLLRWQEGLPLIADAGPDQIVKEGTEVIFDGSASKGNADIINYTWTFDDGSGDIALYDVDPSHTFSVPGIYVVILNVTDSEGMWDLDNMTITVTEVPGNYKPTIIFTSPANNTEISGTVTIKGNASDEDGNETIVKVEVSVNSGGWEIVVGTIHWTFEWDTTTLENGDYSLKFRAFDSTNYSEVKEIILTVQKPSSNNKPPTISITSPKEGKVVTEKITISGSVSDEDGIVEKVEISIKNEDWISIDLNGSTTWEFEWNTKAIDDGKCTIIVRSYDGTNYSNEISISVTVDNKDDTGSGGFIPGFGLMTLIGAIGFVLLSLRKKYEY